MTPVADRRIAVIGAGISGLAAADALAAQSRLVLFEAEPRFGGHSHTVDVRLEGIGHGVDTGFLVFNRRTYPRLVELFAGLGVATARSEMSFSVQVPGESIEWSGSSLNSVFAQRGNLLRPRFLGMLADLLRFNRLASALAQDDAPADESIGDFIGRHSFGATFRDWYLLPMLGCIWSCPTGQMLRMPVGTMLRFCHNHGLLQISDRPQWLTVQGGSQRYVEPLLARLRANGVETRAGCPVLSVRRSAAGVVVISEHGPETFDEVVLACHSDQALALLGDARDDERSVLGAIRYQLNRAVLHTDVSVLPQRRTAWAAWNYERAADSVDEQARVCLHYLINRLQPLPWQTPVVVSLNPRRAIDAARVIGEFDYSHPVFDSAAVAAQARLPGIQGRARVWFCGAWTRYGFHEDGLMSALSVGAALRERLSRTRELQAEAA